MGEKYNISTAQLLLRYSLQKGYTPIVKATSPKHLYANIEAENFVVSEQDIAILDSWDKDIQGSLCMSFHIHVNLSAKRHSSVAEKFAWSMRSSHIAIRLRLICAEYIHVIIVLSFNRIMNLLSDVASGLCRA